MLILSMFIQKSFYEKKTKIYKLSLYEIVKIQIHFRSNYLIFGFIFFINL
jgi:hypothetical protein